MNIRFERRVKLWCTSWIFMSAPPSTRSTYLSRQSDREMAAQLLESRSRACFRTECSGSGQAPHAGVPPDLDSAMVKHLIKLAVANGLARKQIPPASIARARTASSGKAVMKMNGMR